MSEHPILNAQQVSRFFGRHKEHIGLKNIDISVAAGEILCLIGPSGSGKSTLLRVLAGLENIDAGEIFENNQLVSKKDWQKPPEQRETGLVFQDFALFPHLNAADNLGFGLPQLSRLERAMVVKNWLNSVGLSGHYKHFPHQLSGGEQQRLALARALARRPLAVLLDEPFSGLDGSLKDQLAQVTLNALRQSGAAAIIVTHDGQDAINMADKIAVMEHGQIIQLATPAVLYDAPISLSAARGLGTVWAIELMAKDYLVLWQGKVVASPTKEGKILFCARAEQTKVQPNPNGQYIVQAVHGLGPMRKLWLSNKARTQQSEKENIVAIVPVQESANKGDIVEIIADKPLIFQD